MPNAILLMVPATAASAQTADTVRVPLPRPVDVGATAVLAGDYLVRVSGAAGAGMYLAAIRLAGREYTYDPTPPKRNNE
jgi:hypothetical protein